MNAFLSSYLEIMSIKSSLVEAFLPPISIPFCFPTQVVQACQRVIYQSTFLWSYIIPDIGYFSVLHNIFDSLGCLSKCLFCLDRSRYTCKDSFFSVVFINFFSPFLSGFMDQNFSTYQLYNMKFLISTDIRLRRSFHYSISQGFHLITNFLSLVI